MNDLVLFDGYSGGGTYIACFTNTGYADLTQVPYPGGIGLNWNDRAESYTAGIWGGKFYQNTGLTGSTWIFNPDPNTYNFNSQFTRQASSICIANAGPSGCP